MRNILKNTQLVQTLRSRIVSLVNRRNGNWEGTMSDLLETLTSRSVPEVFPASPASLRRAINLQLTTLRREGVKATFTRTTDHTRTRLVSFTRVR